MSLSGSIAAVAISGCSTLPQEKAADMMRGWTRSEVLACAGAPLREAQDGELRVMSYSNVRAIDGTLFKCDLNVTLRAGAVEAVRYVGATNTCASMLRNCK